MQILPGNKFAILGVKEIKSFSHLAASERHNRRLDVPLNADAGRAHLNVDAMPEWAGRSFEARFEELLALRRIDHVHKRAILAVEVLLAMSPEAVPLVPIPAWQDAALRAALEIGGGRGNFLGLDFHHDEKTPHLHAVFVPVVEMVRQARGPQPVNGVRASRKQHVLSFAQFAGHKTREVGKTYARWHDIYATEVAPFGLVRGFPGGRSEHMPQRQLYLRTAELETEGEALQEILVDPLPLFRALRRPTLEELRDDNRWALYLRDIAGCAAKKFAALAPHGALGLVETAKDGIFARRARSQNADLERERRQWQDRATVAERAVETNRTSAQRDADQLRARLNALQAAPLTPRQSVEHFGLPILSIPARDGKIVDRVVASNGEVLALDRDHFARADGAMHSVIKFLQAELGLENSRQTLAALTKEVGPACAEATFLAPFKVTAPAPAALPGTPKVGSTTRLLALQAALETNLGIRREASGALIDTKTLTVDSRGNAVLVGEGSRTGYVFDVSKIGGLVVGRPTTFEPVQLGDAGAWTTVLCDDPVLALKVYSASQGLVSAQVVAPLCVTEEHLQRLKRGHREYLAVESIFARGWNPQQSATILPPEKCLEAAGSAARRDATLPLSQVVSAADGHNHRLSLG